jgi:integral membrane sensor domain MASE1
VQKHNKPTIDQWKYVQKRNKENDKRAKNNLQEFHILAIHHRLIACLLLAYCVSVTQLWQKSIAETQ